MSKKLIYLFTFVLVFGFGLTTADTCASEIKINFQSSGAPIPIARGQDLHGVLLLPTSLLLTIWKVTMILRKASPEAIEYI